MNTSRQRLAMALVAGTLMIASACAPPAEKVEKPAAPSEESDRAAIEQILRQWDAGVNAEDPDALLALYSDDPVMMPPDTPAREGKGSIRDFLAEFFAQGKLQVTDRAVAIEIEGDLAFAHGTYELTITPEGGGSAQEQAGKWAAVFHRQPDGAWKAVRNIWNADTPAPGMPPPPGSTIDAAGAVPMPETATCIREVGDLDTAFEKALEAGKVGDVAALHATDGRRLPPGMTAVDGRRAVAAYIKAQIDMFDPRELDISQAGRQSAGDWGASWGKYRFSYTARDGGAKFTGEGKYLTVAHRDGDGCWRVAWVLWNADSPPAAPPAAS